MAVAAGAVVAMGCALSLSSEKLLPGHVKDEMVVFRECLAWPLSVLCLTSGNIWLPAARGRMHFFIFYLLREVGVICSFRLHCLRMLEAI